MKIETKTTPPSRRLDPARRRLRAQLDGQWLFDTLDACLFYERGRHPVYAIPASLLDTNTFIPAEAVDGDCDGQRWSVVLENETRPGVVRTWPDAPADLPALQGYAAVEMATADAWFEEDTQRYSKPRDPYRRVDILESSRHVRVEIDGVIVADTLHPRLVLETGLPAQWYVPRPDIDWTHLSNVLTKSYCQYKGSARYWDVTVNGKIYEGLAWSYEETIVEAAALAGLVGFPRTDASVNTFIDDVLLDQTEYAPDWHSPSFAVGEHP